MSWETKGVGNLFLLIGGRGGWFNETRGVEPGWFPCPPAGGWGGWGGMEASTVGSVRDLILLHGGKQAKGLSVRMEGESEAYGMRHTE